MLSPLGKIDQPLRRRPIRNRLRKCAHFFVRHELIAECTEFRQHDEVCLSLLSSLAAIAIQILRHLPELRIVLVIPDAHR